MSPQKGFCTLPGQLSPSHGHLSQKHFLPSCNNMHTTCHAPHEDHNVEKSSSKSSCLRLHLTGPRPRHALERKLGCEPTALPAERASRSVLGEGSTCFQKESSCWWVRHAADLNVARGGRWGPAEGGVTEKLGPSKEGLGPVPGTVLKPVFLFSQEIT